MIRSSEQRHLIRRKPRRLATVFSRYDPPLYFITFCTWRRLRIIANPAVHSALKEMIKRNLQRGIAIGRYVIMPDHIHLFIRINSEYRIGQTIRLLKRALSSCLRRTGNPLPHWQPGFFDHVLRQNESYAEKWRYVVDNPVRAGLVRMAEAWPYQGEGVVYRPGIVTVPQWQGGSCR